MLIAYMAAAQGSLLLRLTVKVNNNGSLKGLANTEVKFTELQTGEILKGITDTDGFVSVTFTSGKVWQISMLNIHDYWAWQIAIPPIPAGKTAEYTKRITYDYNNYLRETRVHPDRLSLKFTVQDQKINPLDRPTSGESIVNVQLSSTKGVAMPNVPVALVCYKTLQIYQSKTDEAGTARFKVPNNQDYEIDVDGILNFNYVDVDAKGQFFTKNLVYEPTKVQETINNDTVVQTLPAGVEGTSSRVAIHLKVKKSPGEVWKNEPIFLEEYGGKKVYKGVTDSEGKVDFLLPKGKIYFIHGKFEKRIDGIDLTRFQGIGYSNKTVVYRPDPRYQNPENYIPKPEDRLNYSFEQFFNQQFPPAASGEGIKPYAAFCGQINASSTQAILRLGFQAEAPEKASKPFNAAFVIDRSGSMMGDRIHYLKTALLALVERLRPEDRIAIVSFNDEKTIHLPSQLVGNEKDKIKQIIERIAADGGTNISAGLFEGYEQVWKHFKKNSVNRVVLLSDGYGSDPVEPLVKKSKEYNLKGIECSAVGVGDAYNAAMLTLLASQGSGLLELVQDAPKIVEAFLNEMGSLMNPIATAVKVEVEHNPKMLMSQLYGFAVENKSPGKFSLKLRNVFAGNQQLALVKFTLVNPTAELCKQPIVVKVKFFDLRQNKEVVSQTTLNLQWQEADGELEYIKEANDKKIYAVALINQALKNMVEFFHEGKKLQALAALREAETEIKKILPSADDKDLAPLLLEMERYADILSQSMR
jgi:uncharacterized protein YegL